MLMPRLPAASANILGQRSDAQTVVRKHAACRQDSARGITEQG